MLNGCDFRKDGKTYITEPKLPYSGKIIDRFQMGCDKVHKQYIDFEGKIRPVATALNQNEPKSDDLFNNQPSEEYLAAQAKAREILGGVKFPDEFMTRFESLYRNNPVRRHLETVNIPSEQVQLLLH